MFALPYLTSRLYSLRLPIGLACLMVTATAQSQSPVVVSEAEERWFKVELLVFRHLSKSAASAERWDPSPVLEYPGASRFLVHPETVAANLEQYNGTGRIDEFGRQILTMEPPLLDAYGNPLPLDEFGNLPLLDDNGNALLDEYGDPVFPSKEETLSLLRGDDGEDDEGDTEIEPVPGESLPAGEGEEIPELEFELVPMKPTPFIALDFEAREFRGKAALMARSGRYQILFHESWVQPVLPQADALPIVLDRSGDSRDWPVLQGSIKLYLSRYLHLETNLWLNTMGEYMAQGWQIAPAPLGPQSLIIEYRVELPEVLPNSAQSALPGLLPTEQTFPEAAALPGQANQSAQEWDWEAQETWDFDDLLEAEPVYPWHHAILLQQSRKMRSTEVHYIDHPMLGVVALISPVTEEELDAMATAEKLAAAAGAAVTLPQQKTPQVR